MELVHISGAIGLADMKTHEDEPTDLIPRTQSTIVMWREVTRDQQRMERWNGQSAGAPAALYVATATTFMYWVFDAVIIPAGA